jgi:glycosyltransferase involved in cell wall biosynthesis
VEEKGVDYLLKAIPLIIRELPNTHFIFCGEHRVSYENFWLKVEPLINKYKKYITLLGLLSQQEVFMFYKSLEVLVIPSRTDCFPFAQIEAQLSGTPSVCKHTLQDGLLDGG